MWPRVTVLDMAGVWNPSDLSTSPASSSCIMAMPDVVDSKTSELTPHRIIDPDEVDVHVEIVGWVPADGPAQVPSTASSGSCRSQPLEPTLQKQYLIGHRNPAADLATFSTDSSAMKNLTTMLDHVHFRNEDHVNNNKFMGLFLRKDDGSLIKCMIIWFGKIANEQMSFDANGLVQMIQSIGYTRFLDFVQQSMGFYLLKQWNLQISRKDEIILKDIMKEKDIRFLEDDVSSLKGIKLALNDEVNASSNIDSWRFDFDGSDDIEDMAGVITVNQIHGSNFDPCPIMQQKIWAQLLILDNNKNIQCDAKRKGLSSLPLDIQENVLARLDIENLTRAKIISTNFKEIIESDTFHALRGEIYAQEGSFTTLFSFIFEGIWHCIGFDLFSNSWRQLPPFSYLPPPNLDLFKEYSICGDNGLMCINISKSPQVEELVVFNPLIKKTRILPPLLFRRNPVLLQMLVDPSTKSYIVIAVGSSTMSDGNLSKKTEVFDSRTSQWKERQDLPGPHFALNEHQTGVFVNNILYCLAFLDGDLGKGVIAYNVEKGEWLSNWICPLPSQMNANILQLVENNNEVYLFSEQDQGGNVDHCIYILEDVYNTSIVSRWRIVIIVSQGGKHGLQVYPEYICVPYGKDKLCIFNTIEYVGVVYDIRKGKRLMYLPPPPRKKIVDAFYNLNPLSFTFQPSFKFKIF